MLTQGLESLIGKGKAQYKTFTFGTSGVSRIPVPKGSFIIIVDFDYWYFIDPPPATEGTPATAIVSWNTTEPVTDITYQLNGIPAVPPIITFDTADPLQAQNDFQAFLNANLPGFNCSVTLVSVGLDFQWGITITTSTPGTAYNGMVPVVTFNPLPALSAVGDFSGGSDGAYTIADIVANSTHQLEFRSTKSRNHYIIRENVDIFSFIPVSGDPSTFFYNVKGFYHRDCYLVHTESVQIDIIKVPVPETWIVDYGRLGQVSQEENLPVGYGQDPVGLPAVKEVIFNGVIPGESYKPQTPGFTELLNGAAQEQFKLNVSGGRQLANPVDPVVPNYSNGRNYPVVNVGYVLINMDYNDYVKSS